MTFGLEITNDIRFAIGQNPRNDAVNAKRCTQNICGRLRVTGHHHHFDTLGQKVLNGGFGICFGCV